MAAITIQAPSVNLDGLVMIIAIAMVIGSVITGRAAKVTLLILLWHTLNVNLVYIVDDRSWYSYWPTLTTWSLIMSSKDYVFMALVGISNGSEKLIITICFSISCLLHQLIAIEVYNQNLTLFYYRPDIMAFLVSAMFASIILILMGGGSNGGKRVKRSLFLFDYRINNIFHYQTLKVTK